MFYTCRREISSLSILSLFLSLFLMARRIAVIQKKCKELKDLGISIGVAYSSRKSNGLFVFGDRRITSVTSHLDEIVLIK